MRTLSSESQTRILVDSFQMGLTTSSELSDVLLSLNGNFHGYLSSDKMFMVMLAPSPQQSKSGHWTVATIGWTADCLAVGIRGYALQQGQPSVNTSLLSYKQESLTTFHLHPEVLTSVSTH